MITVKNLCKYYDAGTTKEVRAIDDVSFAIPDHSFTAIVGKSGSGKSTILNLLGGLETASGGTVYYDNYLLPKANNNELARFRREKVGFVFQHYNLVPSISAFKNIMLAWEINGGLISQGLKQATEIIKFLGLESRAQHRAADLSGGEQQRVAIARALVKKPQVILADEPTGNLDTETGDEIINLFEKINREQKTTIVMVTHDLDYAHRAQHLINMKDGKII